MKQLALTLISILVSGCVQLAEREYYEGPKVKPCEKLVVLHPEETVVCMTREEFARYLKKILPPSQ